MNKKFGKKSNNLIDNRLSPLFSPFSERFHFLYLVFIDISWNVCVIEDPTREVQTFLVDLNKALMIKYILICSISEGNLLTESKC